MPRRPVLIPPGLGLAGAVVAVSFAAPLFRLAEAPALTAAFWRLAIALVILAPFAVRSWSAWLGYSRRDAWATLAAGVALGAHFGFWVSSLAYTTVAASVSLVTLQAVWVAVGSHVFLGERLSRRGWTGVFVATGGALVIGASDGLSAPDSGRALWGDSLALLGGLGSAVYMIVGRRLRPRHDLVTYVVPVYAVAAMTLLVSLPLLGQPLATGLGERQWLFFLLLALVPMIGGHTLANWCLRHLPAHTVATWILLEPAGAALLAWPLLGEIPSWAVVVGGGLVLLGAWQTLGRAAGSSSSPPVPAA